MSDWISDGCSSGLLEIVPSFDIAQTVYEALPLEAALEDYDAITALGSSVSIFTTWRDAYVAYQLWVKRRVVAPGAVPDTVMGARRAGSEEGRVGKKRVSTCGNCLCPSP